MCRFIESIRVENGEVFLLDFHQKRVNQTLESFGSSANICLYTVINQINIPESGLFKLKIIYGINDGYSVSVEPYIRKQIADFSLVASNDINYSFKYENREKFVELKAVSNSSEIIIIKNDLVTDTTFSNIIFFKNNQWFTPKSYLLNGVQRQNLLLLNKIQEIKIATSEIRLYSHFQLINALNPLDGGFIYPVSNISNLP